MNRGARRGRTGAAAKIAAMRAIVALAASIPFAAMPGTAAAGAVDEPTAPSSTGATAAPDADLAAFRAERVASLKGDEGWLTLVGLLWLKPGDNTFGRGERNSLVLDDPALPERAGTFRVHDGRVTFTAARGAHVTVDGKPVATIEIAHDHPGPATMLECGPVQFHVIERAGRLLVRARDPQSPRVRAFAGLEYFPVSSEWRFDARFEPYEPVHRIPIMNVLGYEDLMTSPGAIVFTKDGREFRLDAIRVRPTSPELFVMFADGTTGHETYGAGRFLFTPLPKDGHVAVDFNRSINPPCAFNMFATCPLPPAQNRLAVRVEAGELKYAGEH